ncbi:MAG: EamA family transporter [Spirochaetota bacterium]|nr:EamA family transporter [Spirochaetota bacterium]
MTYVYLLLTVFFTVAGQLILKQGSASIQGKKPKELIRSMFNKHVILGGALTFMAPVFYILALRNIELSVAFAFTSMIYIFVVLGGRVFFKEIVSLYHVLGIMLITLGIVLFGL